MKRKSLSICTKVIGADGRRKLVMSNRGWESLTSEQREALVMVIIVMVIIVMVVIVMVVIVVIVFVMVIIVMVVMVVIWWS